MSYTIEPKDRFFQALCILPEREIRPGVTVTFTSLVDLTAVEAIRHTEQQLGLQKDSYTAFVIKALSLALKEFPYANRRVFRPFWMQLFGPRMQSFSDCDIAVAVERDMPGRESVAFVDILRNADQRSLAEITEWLHSLATSDAATNKQWREFSTIIQRFPFWISSFIIRVPCWIPSMWVKYRGAAAIVTSPAKYGVGGVFAAWAWPVGMSFGYVEQRPVVREGQIVARPTFNLVLNFDRRVMAGAQAARFFKRIVDILENPNAEMGECLHADCQQPARVPVQ